MSCRKGPLNVTGGGLNSPPPPTPVSANAMPTGAASITAGGQCNRPPSARGHPLGGRPGACRPPALHLPWLTPRLDLLQSERNCLHANAF
jgi:hypothetical protein